MKDRGRPTMKELIAGGDKVGNEEPKERIPNYITKPSQFSCPVSSCGIMWHRGFIYSSCPLVAGQRDMPACSKCIYKSSRQEQKSNRNDRQEEKKPIVEVAIKERAAVPKIGKTYTSE